MVFYDFKMKINKMFVVSVKIYLLLTFLFSRITLAKVSPSHNK